MADNLSYELFPIIPEASINETARPGQLFLEYVQFSVTIATNTGDAEVPTKLGSVLGFIPLSFSSVFASGDSVNNYTTDGVVTTGAVTVRVNSTSIADGALICRGFLVGTKSPTALTFS